MTDSVPPPSPALVQVIRSYARGLRRCYELELRTNPDISGARSLKWTIDEDGSVVDVDVSVPDAPVLESCLERQIRRWRFPPPESGKIEVSYPLP